MEDINDITYKALDRYFTVLQHTGYVPQKDVNKLLLLQFIQEMLVQYSEYITAEDYNIIARIVQCLSDSSCLIPYIQYKAITQPIESYILSTPIRITENRLIRHTEVEEALRLVNQ